MQLTIEILAVTPTTKPTAKGSYTQLDVAFKKDGKTEGKKIMSFGNSQPAYNVLKNAKFGETYTITSEKNEKSGYWDWVNAELGGGTVTTGAKATPTASPKSTYETAEERAKKQVYIVRQSSISAAVELLKTEKKQPTAQEVIAVAREFEAYVFDQGNTPVESVELPEDDVPL